MKTLWQVISLLCVLHILALAGGVGWLAGTQRIDRDRVAEAAELFKLPVTEEQAQQTKLEQIDQQIDAQAGRIITVQNPTAEGQSTVERLAAERQLNEMTLRQLERTRQEIENLRRNLQLSKDRVDAEYRDLVAQKTALEQRIKELEAQRNEAGFKKNIELFETLQAKQTKAVFMSLIDQNQMEQVVSYLHAMEPRKAAAVLKEFKTDDEVARVVELTERLRARGSNLVKDAENVG